MCFFGFVLFAGGDDTLRLTRHEVELILADFLHMF